VKSAESYPHRLSTGKHNIFLHVGYAQQHSDANINSTCNNSFHRNVGENGVKSSKFYIKLNISNTFVSIVKNLIETKSNKCLLQSTKGATS